MRWLPAIGLWTVAASGCASLAGLDDYGDVRDDDGGGGSVTATGGSPETGGSDAATGGAPGKGGGSTSYQDAVSDDGPLAYWPMDVISSDTTTPDVENGFDLALVAGPAPTTGLFGTSNGALDLSTGGYLESQDPIFAFDGTTHFAIEIWYQHLGGLENVLVQRFGPSPNGNTGYRLRVNKNGNLAFERWDDSATPDLVTLSPMVALREVLHLFARYESGCMCLFAIKDDGSTSSDCAISTSQIVIEDSLRLWMSVPTDNYKLEGILDEAAIYVGPLPLPTPKAIADHHELAILGTPVADFLTTGCE